MEISKNSIYRKIYLKSMINFLYDVDLQKFNLWSLCRKKMKRNYKSMQRVKAKIKIKLYFNTV